MHDLIEIYLTGRLSDDQKEQFDRLLATDETFRRDYQLSLAALAVTDFSMGSQEIDEQIPNFDQTVSDKNA
ncbi:MAG: hypothetical protein K2G21_04140 [Muribaculaceae bacterium]|nr:hypothetical protein [Muribaculaceae bacterium]